MPVTAVRGKLCISLQRANVMEIKIKRGAFWQGAVLSHSLSGTDLIVLPD